MRRFLLERNEDVSGISGVGVVAEGIEFSDGVCVIRWKTVPVASTAIYDTAQELIDVHGHEGATQIRWIDGADSSQVASKNIADVNPEDETHRVRDALGKTYGGYFPIDLGSVPTAWRTDGYNV